MKKRTRKKWLKKNGLYVNPKETWSLDFTIAKFVLPRLKLFKKLNNAYPGTGDMDTFEKWNKALDKMINAFELIATGDMYYGLMDDKKTSFADIRELCEQKQKEIEEGLKLFSEWFQHLWW